MTKARQHLFHTFTIDYQSDIDDMRYQGTFTIKKLSVADSSALGVRKAQLNGGMHHNPDKPGYGIDEETDNFNAMMAHLQISITTAPKWWNLDEITDINLMVKVYQEVTQFENSFLYRKRNAGTATGSMGSDSGASNSNASQANAEGKPGTVVDQEVQRALEL